MVIGARSLINADGGVFSGTSDPYVMARAGGVGSTWEEKGEGGERQSEPLSNTTEPTWNMACE